MGFWKKVFFHSPITYIVCFSVCCIISLVYSYFYSFSSARISESILNSGIMMVFVGILVLCSFYGAFDTFAYGFQSLRSKKNRKYEDLVQYTRIKGEERSKKSLPYVPFMVVGLLFVIVGIILSFIIK